MKRDMDLVRAILMEVENVPDEDARRGVTSIDGYDSATFARHVQLMQEAGLVEAAVVRADGVGAIKVRVDRLTWKGHDFLDAIRNDTVWSKTKSAVAETVGSASFDVLKAVAASLAMKALGLGGA